jgi:plasmid stabilization system protein ParE
VKPARLVLSDAAVADILEQADWYIAQSGQALAERWEKAVTSAALRVIKNPATGAPCRFRPVELRNVRRTTIRGFAKHLHLLQNSSSTEFEERKFSSFVSSTALVTWRSCSSPGWDFDFEGRCGKA